MKTRSAIITLRRLPTYTNCNSLSLSHVISFYPGVIVVIIHNEMTFVVLLTVATVILYEDLNWKLAL